MVKLMLVWALIIFCFRVVCLALEIWGLLERCYMRFACVRRYLFEKMGELMKMWKMEPAIRYPLGFFVWANDKAGGREEPPEWILFLTGMFVVLSTMYFIAKASEYGANYYRNFGTRKKSSPGASSESAEPSKSSNSSVVAESPEDSDDKKYGASGTNMTEFELDNFRSVVGVVSSVDLLEFSELRAKREVELGAELAKLEMFKISQEMDAQFEASAIRNSSEVGAERGEVELRAALLAEKETALIQELDELNRSRRDPTIVEGLWVQLKERRDVSQEIGVVDLGFREPADDQISSPPDSGWGE